MKSEIEIREDALIEVWNLLNDMWIHHGDGSDFWPIPKDCRESFDTLMAKRKYYAELSKDTGHTVESTLAFNIIFNEIRPIIRNSLPEEKWKLILMK